MGYQGFFGAADNCDLASVREVKLSAVFAEFFQRPAATAAIIAG
jgi:hypothetical protein